MLKRGIMNKAFVERLDALGYESPLTIADVVKDMSANKYVLPSIKREFVWSTSQIEKLFDSVMQDYSSGNKGIPRTAGKISG